MEESIEYFATTRKVEKCDLTLQHLENLELVSDNGGWEVEKLTTLFKVMPVIALICYERRMQWKGKIGNFNVLSSK